MSPRRQAGIEPSAEQPSAVVETPDVQELRKTVEELRAQLERERASHDEQLRQFGYGISHDLREPLRMVASYTQLLERRYEGHLDEAGREFMQFIVTAVQRMDRLLNDVLIYSNQYRGSDQRVSMAAAEGALQGALLNLDQQIRESKAVITSDPLPEVPFDFAQLTQLFRQLIGNAITFRGPEPPRIHISFSEDAHTVIFCVRDSGIGIEPRYHEQIFGLFRRLHGREYPGTGMGLAICKRILELRGGKIWVESDLGQGAAFYFSLPK